MKTRRASWLLLLPCFLFASVGAVRAELFAPSSVSSSATVERVSKTREGPKFKTTRKVTVKLHNMAPDHDTVVGIECWMIYKNLADETLAVQHQQKSVWRIPSGHSGSITADESLFEYTPVQFKSIGGLRRSIVRRIPPSGHKYYGFVVRVFENGKVINEISTASKLPDIASHSYFTEGGSQTSSSRSKSPSRQSPDVKTGQL